MINRREAGKLLAAAAGAIAAGAAFAQEDRTTQVPAHRPGSGNSVGVNDLISEPLGEMQNPEVTMLTLSLAPGSTSHAHRHIGPVFAYILEGSIENQVDPDPPKTYHPGDFFYEPPMHVHRLMRNLSATETAKILVVQVGEKGKPFTIEA